MIDQIPTKTIPIQSWAMVLAALDYESWSHRRSLHSIGLDLETFFGYGHCLAVVPSGDRNRGSMFPLSEVSTFRSLRQRIPPHILPGNSSFVSSYRRRIANNVSATRSPSLERLQTRFDTGGYHSKAFGIATMIFQKKGWPGRMIGEPDRFESIAPVKGNCYRQSLPTVPVVRQTNAASC